MKKVSGELKLLYSQYRELQSFAQFGSDLDADTKARLALGERIVEVLKQGRNAPVRVGCQVAIVYAAVKGFLDSTPVKQVKEYEARLFAVLENKYGEWLARVESGNWDADDEEKLKVILKELEV
jgi:F-type H+-transporting ATPase subunit alpha